MQTVNVTDALTGLTRAERPGITVTQISPPGVPAATVEALYVALTGLLEASSNAVLKKIQGGEK
jgi:hypothetical protein